MSKKVFISYAHEDPVDIRALRFTAPLYQPQTILMLPVRKNQRRNFCRDTRSLI